MSKAAQLNLETEADELAKAEFQAFKSTKVVELFEAKARNAATWNDLLAVLNAKGVTDEMLAQPVSLKAPKGKSGGGGGKRGPNKTDAEKQHARDLILGILKPKQPMSKAQVMEAAGADRAFLEEMWDNEKKVLVEEGLIEKHGTGPKNTTWTRKAKE